ncbi:MAG: response regulator transcription factor [Candidatus Merdivicinus sp.]|jgi:two-component system response regulator YesN
MIRVLVVEDDKIARNGLIRLLPWKAYKMEVVAEAANGKTAMEYLESNNGGVDLILTDIMMPIVNGIELVSYVSEHFPTIACVVVTLHEDIKLAQQAIRAGAIDFVQKSELDLSDFDNVLSRISSQLQKNTIKRNLDAIRDSEIYCLIPPSQSRMIPESLRDISGVQKRLDRIYLLYPSECGLDSHWIHTWVLQNHGWFFLRLIDTCGLSRIKLDEFLDDYCRGLYFYEYGSGTAESMHSIFEEDPVQFHPDLSPFSSDFSWIFDTAALDQFLFKLGELKPDRRSLIAFAKEIRQKISSYYLLSEETLDPHEFSCYSEFKEWIGHLRNLTCKKDALAKYSPEVQSSIQQAIEWISENLGTSLTAGEVAKRVNLSRSYFNKCFKDIMGLSFNTYLQERRIQKACWFLQNTAYNLSYISNQLGWMDEKYFSKLFKKTIGLLPSEYRKANLHRP